MDIYTIIYLLVALFLLSATAHRVWHRHYISAIIFGALFAIVALNWFGIISIPFLSV